MNRFYRHIWSKTLGQAIVVPECAGGGAGRKAGRRRGGSLVALALILATAPGSGAIADTAWTNAGGDGDWHNAANWSNGVPSNTGNRAYITGPGTATISQAASGENWTRVGYGGGNSGAISVGDGGSLTAGCCFYLGANGGTGTMTVSGTGTVTTPDIFMVGDYGSTGHLTIENGGTVNSGSNTFVGRWDGSTGFATVTGQDSVWNTSWNLTLAGESPSSATAYGELTISDGGLVRVNSGNSALRIGYAADSTGLLNIGAAEGNLAAAAGMLQASSAVFGAGNSSIVFNHTDPGYIFSTPISGNGEVRQLAGTTSLTGSNSWSGSTVVEGGVLRAGGASGLSGNATYEVNGGTLDLNDFNLSMSALSGTGGEVDLGSASLAAGSGNTDTSFAGVIKGTGGFEKTGTGTLTLTGANSWTGGTTISGGMLAGNTTSLVGDILNNATLAFDQSVDGSFSGAVSGTGSLVKLGNGVLTLTGTNSYGGGTTVSAGTLRAGNATAFVAGTAYTVNGGTLDFNDFSRTIAALSGTGGTVDLGSATLTVDQSVNTVFAGAIGGSGGLVKSGAGTLSLTGASVWTGNTSVDAGTLGITDGGTVSNTFGYIGASAGGTGEVTVDGADSIWTNSGELIVGLSGTGTLGITGGGTVSNTTGYIGNYATGTGEVTVDGAGSTWTNSGDLNVGRFGTGTLGITGGGGVSNTFARIGTTAGGTGEVTVDGADSAWTNSSYLTVGYLGTGTLGIAGGGTVSNTSGIIGSDSGTGEVTVSGADSTWTNSNNLNVGSSGTGTLGIAGGGTVSNTIGTVGHTAGSTGGVTVDGAGSTWTNSNNLVVGNSGTGTLGIAGGGMVSNTIGLIGRNSGGTGDVTVDGADSTWTNSDQLIVGNSGTGTLGITGGGRVSNTSEGYIGASAGGTGEVTVSGAGSTWTNSDELYVGAYGTGTLGITGGGTVSNTWQSYIGAWAGSTGDVTVDGADSTWTNSGFLNVGHSGTGTLGITDGGTVSNATSYIGYFTGGTGEVTVSGADSTWTNSSNLTVGNSGTGTLGITDGGTVKVGGGAGTVRIADQAGSTGTLNIGAASGDAAVAAGTLDAASVAFGAGTGTLVFNHMDSDYLFAAGISGNGEVRQLAGTTILTGANSWSGGTTVSGGTLKGSTASLVGDIAITGGTVEFDQASAGAFTGEITGTGRLVKSGEGETVFSGSGIEADYFYVRGMGTVLDGVAVDIANRLDISNQLESGGTTDAGLTIRGGANVTSGQGSIGDIGNFEAAVTVSGAGSTWTIGEAIVPTSFSVSGEGAASLLVEDGGKVDVIGTADVFSRNDGPASSVTVTGGNSAFDVSGLLAIGSGGTGELTVSNGGSVHSGSAEVGVLSPRTGIVTITGTGSEWLVDGSSLVLGGNNGNAPGTGHLTLADDGLLRVGGGTGTLHAALGDGSTARINIGAAEGEDAAAAGTLDLGTIAFDTDGGGDGRLLFNHTATDYLFGALLEGAGTVSHLAGVTTFTGLSTAFTGTTFVDAGALIVNGLLGGTLDVGAGLLGGSGTVGTTALGAGAIFAPGNSIGTLNVSGDLLFGSLSIYEVELDDGGNTPGVNNDFIDVVGALTIDSGASVSVRPENGTDDGSTYTPGLVYTILSAANGITGAFDAVTASFAFLTPSLDYDANNVYLTLDIVADFQDVAQTPNQQGVANTVQTFGPGNTLYDGLLGLTEDQARSAFNSLSGEAHASASTSPLPGMQQIRQQILDRLARIFGGGFGGFGSAAAKQAPAAGDAPAPGHAVWGQLFGSWGKTDGNAVSAAIDRDSYGFIGGADREIAPGVHAGVALGYSRSTWDVSARSSSGDSDNFHIAGYAGTALGAVDLKGVVSYAYGRADTDRTVIVGVLTNELSASYATHTFQAGIEAGYDLDMGPVVLTPFAGLAGVHVETEDFTETGGPAALTFASTGNTTGVTTLGLRARHQAGSVGLTGAAAWRHAFGDVEPTSRAAFASSPAATFAVRGAPLVRDALAVEGGFEARIDRAATLSFGYSGEYSSDTRDHALMAELRVEF